MSKIAPKDKAIAMFLEFVEYCDKKEMSYEYIILLALRELFVNRKI